MEAKEQKDALIFLAKQGFQFQLEELQKRMEVEMMRIMQAPIKRFSPE